MGKKLKPYEIYQLYISLKTHFTSLGYDFFKNNPKNATLKAYEKRSDKWVFEKLEKCHCDLTSLMVSNLLLDTSLWPEFLVRDEAHQNYLERERRIQSLGYVFVQDLKKCKPHLNENILCKKNELPPLIRLWVNDTLCIETVCIVSALTNCVPYWETQLRGDTLWKDRLHLRLVKYRPFVFFDTDVFRRKLVKTFQGMGDV